MHSTSTPNKLTQPSLPRWPAYRRMTIWLVVSLALAGVFALYVQPDFMVLLADQVWACL